MTVTKKKKHVECEKIKIKRFHKVNHNRKHELLALIMGYLVLFGFFYPHDVRTLTPTHNLPDKLILWMKLRKQHKQLHAINAEK